MKDFSLSRRSLSPATRFALTLAAALLLGHTAQASTYTWNGTGTSWQTAGDWNNGASAATTAPSATTLTEFNSSGYGSNTPTTGTTAAATGAIWVTNGVSSGTLTIAGTSTLTIAGNLTSATGPGGVANTGILLDDTTNNSSLTINPLVVLGNPTTFTVNSSGTLSLSGGVSTSHSLTLTGSNASGVIAINGFATTGGSGALNVNTSGTVLLYGTGSDYGGSSITLTSGTLDVNSSTAFSAPLYLNGGTINNTSGSAITVGGTVYFGGSGFTAFASNSTSSNNLTIGGVTGTVFNPNASYTITLNGSGATLAFSGNGSGGLLNNSSGAQTLTVNGAGNTLSFYGYNLSNGTGNYTDIINGTGNVSLGVVANGTGSTSGLTYNGTGTLSLTGASSFTGGLNVYSGVVQTANSAGLGASTSTVTLGNSSGTGSTYNAALAGDTNVNIANPILVAAGTSGNTLTIEDNSAVNHGVTFTGPIALNNNVTLTNLTPGTAALTLSGTVTESNAAETITLNNGSSAGSGVATISGAVVIGSSGLTLINNGGGTAPVLTLSGGVSTASSGTLTIQNDSTQASGITISTGSITLAGAIVNSGTSTGSTLISAPIGSSVTNITENGASPLVLSHANAGFAGTVTVTSGTLQLATGNALGGAANTNAITVNGGALDVDGTANTIAGVSDGGVTTGTVTNSSATSSLLTIDGTGSSTFGGSVTGSVSLAKTVGGFQTLSGTNSYTGTTNIAAGTLEFGQDKSLYNDATASWTKTNIDVASGATLALGVGGGSYFTTSDITALLANLEGSTTSTGLLAGASLGFDTTNATSGTFTISNTIADTTGSKGGSIGVTKLGTGTLVLTAANTYTGTTSISAGAVQLGNALAVQNSTVAIGTANGLTFSGGIGAFTIGGLAGSANEALVDNSSVALTSLTLNGTSGSYGGVLSGAGTNLIVSTTGTQTFTGANTYTGYTELDGGVLSVTNLAAGGSPSGLGESSNLASNLVFGGGTLQYSGSSNGTTDRLLTSGDAAGNATTIDASGAGTFSFTNTGSVVYGNIANQTLTLTGTNTGANTFALAVGDYNGGAATTTLDKTGVGNWILTNSNKFAGVAVSAGSLQLGNANAIAEDAGKAVTLSGTGALTYSSGIGTFNVGILSGSGNGSVLSDTGGSAVNLSLYDIGTSTATFSGLLSGNGGITKGGVYAQILNDASDSYSGTTTVSNQVINGNAGTLETTLTTSGTPFGTGSINLQGGNLTLAPTGSTTSAITITADSATGATFNYTAGEINLNKGTTTGGLSLSIGTLSQGTNGTLIIQTSAADLGTLGNGERVYVNANAGDTTPPLTNGIVSPSIVGLSSAGNASFLTYNTTNGFIDYAGTGETSSFSTAANGVYSVTMGAASQTITQGTGNAYAMLINSSTDAPTISGTVNLGNGSGQAGLILETTVSSGALLAGSGSFNFGGAAGVVQAFTSGGVDSLGSVTFAGTNGVTFGGSGNITLASGQTFSGGLTINNIFLSDGGGSNSIFGAPSNVITVNGGGGFYATATSALVAGRSVVIGGGNATLNSAASYEPSLYGWNFSGSGALNVGNQGGGGPIVLAGNNSYTGGTIISNELVISSDANLGGASTPITFETGYGLGSDLSIMGLYGNGLSNSFGSHALTFQPLPISDFAYTAIDIQDPANTFTVAQNINIGGDAFRKYGAGTLVLSAVNTYTGTTTLYGGTLQVNETTGSLASTSNVAFNGGSLDIVGNASGSTTQTLGNVALSGAGGSVLTANSNGGSSTTVNLGTIGSSSGSPTGLTTAGTTLDIVVDNHSSVTTTTAPDSSTGVGNTNVGIYGGRVVFTNTSTGATDWATTTSGSGPYVLSGYNSYVDLLASKYATDNVSVTGSESIPTAYGLNGAYAENSLKIITTGANQVLDLGTLSLPLASGGLLFTGSNNYTIQDGTLVAGSTSTTGTTDLIIQQYGTGTLTISAAIANATVANSGLASGTSASTLTTAGPGTIVLTGANTYTGSTYIDGGVLSIASAGELGSGTATLTINGGTLRASSSFTLARSVLAGSGGATIDLTNGSTLTLSGALVGSSTNYGAGSLVLTSSDNSNGVLNVTSAGYLGEGITINGGTLETTASIFGVGSNYLTFGNNTATHETLELNGTSGVIGGLLGTSATNAIIENGSSTTNDTLTDLQGSNSTYAGTIINGGTKTLGFLKAGGGTLTLTNAANSYTGATEIDNGLLNVASLATEGSGGGTNSTIGASGNAAANLLFGGAVADEAVLQYTGSSNVATDRLFTLGDANGSNGAIDSSGAGTVSFTNTGAIAFANAADTHNLTLTGTNAGDNIFAPVLADSSLSTSLTKSGVGTWNLTGADTYSGATAVNAGQLDVNGSTGSSAFTVASGAFVGGTGSIGGPVTINAGGGINMHGSTSGTGTTAVIGTLTVGSLAINNTSSSALPALTFDITSGGSNNLDKIVDSGALTLGGTNGITITIDNLAGSSTLSTGTYTLISYGGTTLSTAQFGYFSISDPTLDGDSLTLKNGSNLLQLVVGVNATTGTYTLTSTLGSTVLHQGATTTATTTLANTGGSSGDTLNYTGLGSTAATGTVTGSTGAGGPVGTGSSTSVTQTYTATTVGTDTVTPTGTVSGVSAGTPVDSGTTTATVTVYSGAGVWKAAGSGTWGSTITAAPANWTAAGGTPGITPGFLTTDSASFGNTGFTGTATVSLGSASPYLNAITFNNSAGTYDIEQGGTGTLHLDSTTTATVTVSAGSHIIGAPIELDSAAATAVAGSSTLTINGTISQSGTQGLALTGAGTTILSGANTYGGTTSVSAGTLLVSNTSAGGSATGTGSLSVSGGATIGGYGTSSGTGFSLSGSSTSNRANVLVGLNSAADTNTSHVLTLKGTGASTIAYANLTFNLDAKSQNSTQLAVGNTNITFGAGVKFTLDLQNEPAIVGAYTPYVLIAGTGTTTDSNGVSGGQYSGLTLGAVTTLTTGGTDTIITGSNLQLAFGSTIDTSYYGSHSYLVLYQNAGVDDIEVEVVPEPGTWALMLGGLVMLVFWQRRRDKNRP